MRVEPLRNKPFVCDECGEEIDTENNYRKVILVSFRDGEKLRNKFCSPQCLEKWNLVHAKETLPQESLEEEVEPLTAQGDEDVADEEEPHTYEAPQQSLSTAKRAKYVPEPSPPEYKTEEEAQPEPHELDPYAEAKEDSDDIQTVKSGYVYEKGATGQKKVRTQPKSTLEKLRDRLKSFGILYEREDWK